MPDHHRKKRFLILPKYIGGSRAFREFIYENLRYPQAAIDSMIEGTVVVEYDIHDDGSVSDAHILKGIGYGCDEEAIRVVSLLRFEKVKNRGIRVKLTSKTSIRFSLWKSSINYTVSYTGKEPDKPGTGPDKKRPLNETYDYTVRF